MMRQVLNPELVRPNAISKRQTGGLGVGAAAIGVASLFWREAGSQAADGTVSKTSGLLSPTGDEQLEGAIVEPVLFASQVLTEQVLPAPMGTIPVVASLEPTQISNAGSAIASTPLPISAVPLVAGQPVPATMMVANVQEVAQASAGGTASDADGGGSYWPEGHWDYDGKDSGLMGGAFALGGTTLALTMLGGGGWLLWRYLNTEPYFDHVIAFASFEEMPCGAVVFTAAGKDEDGDSLTYSLVDSETDDSALLQIDEVTGEVTFINDPGYNSPGDLDQDRVYNFVVQIEDGDGNTATQKVELSILPRTTFPFDVNSPWVSTSFVQHGGSVCADEFDIGAASDSPSLFDVSGGVGNDYAYLEGVMAPANEPVYLSDYGLSTDLYSYHYDLGVDLGLGEDTFHLDDGSLTPTDILVDLGPNGRDTVVLDEHVQTLVIQNFDANDRIYLNNKYLEIDVEDLSLAKTSTFTASAGDLDDISFDVPVDYTVNLSDQNDEIVLFAGMTNSGSIDMGTQNDVVRLTDSGKFFSGSNIQLGDGADKLVLDVNLLVAPVISNFADSDKDILDINVDQDQVLQIDDFGVEDLIDVRALDTYRGFDTTAHGSAADAQNALANKSVTFDTNLNVYIDANNNGQWDGAAAGDTQVWLTGAATTLTADNVQTSIVLDQIIVKGLTQLGTPYPSESLALLNLGEAEIVGYQNGEDSFLLISNNDEDVFSTIKLQDYILEDYSQIVL